jgi:hypothetical protein
MGIKLASELDNAKKINVPGAGTYEPQNSVTIVKQQYPSFSMGQKLPSDLDNAKKLKVPGPGSYANSAEKLKNAAPSYGFGTM